MPVGSSRALIFPSNADRPFRRNSLFLMTTSVTNAAVGFLFWFVAARMYAPEDVGIAVVMVSSMTLPLVLSRLGLDQAIVRFFPSSDRSSIFTTALTVTTSVAVLLGVIVLIIAPEVSRELTALRDFAALFIVFLIAHSVLLTSGISLIALRRADYYFVQNAIGYSRMLFILPLIAMGAYGIFSAIGISVVIASVFAIVILHRLGVKVRQIAQNRGSVEYRYALPNYLFTIMTALPVQLMPLVVLNALGAEEAAKYYMAYAVSSFLSFIPGAILTSMFVEGSHGRDVEIMARKSVKYLFVLLLPAVLALLILSEDILALIGSEYKEASDMLRVVAVCSIPMGISGIYFTILQIRKEVWTLVFLSAATFCVLMTLGISLTPAYGIAGAGYSWLASYCVCSAIIGALVFRDTHTSSLRRRDSK